MRLGLWPKEDEAEQRSEVQRFLAGQAKEPLCVLIAEEATVGAVGFAELSIHPYAEGCQTDHVAYLEAWYVHPAFRGGGVGRALVAAAEDWARAQGCSELASDTEVANLASTAAHQALGFTVAGEVRCFRKDL
jgi:aminoglycoside 6'-N-acetyltransferase I